MSRSRQPILSAQLSLHLGPGVSDASVAIPASMESPHSTEAKLHPIDERFAELVRELSSGDPHVQLAAALVSHARSLGHICLDLHAMERGACHPVLRELAGASLPKLSTWIMSLRESPAVGTPGEFKPLILDDLGRLYLHRYWQYETAAAAALQSRANMSLSSIDPKLLRDGLNRLFPLIQPDEIDWQLVAAFAALRKGLCVISGGPGTGKTRTVVVLLTLLLEQRPELRIVLAAPTGKATARLQESIKQTKASLLCSETIREKLPEEASTIHRLLGSIPHSAYFRHGAHYPLPVDVIVVDEASMVDLALMAKLLEAMPPTAQLILLGDKDQLAAVEAGSVLTDICGAKEPHGFSKEFHNQFEQLTGRNLSGGYSQLPHGLGDCIVELRRNYRFGNDSPIFRLSQAVNQADPDRALIILRETGAARPGGLAARPLPAPDRLKAQLRELVLDRFKPYLLTEQPADALAELGRFRILSPLRSGPFGVETLNQLVEEILREAGVISGRGPFYPGRPIMVTRNDYNLKLFNGDIGVIRPDTSTGQLRAWFPSTDGATRSYLPLRLPEHDTAFALTVHKSQGSEFQSVLFILPNEDSPIVTRELVYTGLTRASQRVELWFTEPLLRTAIGRKTVRHSGLRDALWGAPSSSAPS